MRKVGMIEVHEHPIPDRWVIGTLHEYGDIDIIVSRRNTGEYIVTAAGNIMDGKTGEFSHVAPEGSLSIYPTLYAAFEAFQKFYQ